MRQEKRGMKRKLMVCSIIQSNICADTWEENIPTCANWSLAWPCRPANWPLTPSRAPCWPTAPSKLSTWLVSTFVFKRLWAWSSCADEGPDSIFMGSIVVKTLNKPPHFKRLRLISYSAEDAWGIYDTPRVLIYSFYSDDQSMPCGPTNPRMQLRSRYLLTYILPIIAIIPIGIWRAQYQVERYIHRQFNSRSSKSIQLWSNYA